MYWIQYWRFLPNLEWTKMLSVHCWHTSKNVCMKFQWKFWNLPEQLYITKINPCIITCERNTSYPANCMTFSTCKYGWLSKHHRQDCSWSIKCPKGTGRHNVQRHNIPKEELQILGSGLYLTKTTCRVGQYLKKWKTSLSTTVQLWTWKICQSLKNSKFSYQNLLIPTNRL